MHPKTRAILDDLKARGIDTSSWEAQLDAKPDADKFFADGFTRTPEFTKILTEKRQVEQQLNSARSELAAAQTQLQNPNNGLSASQMQALRTKIESLKTFLVSEEYPTDQVNGLFNEFDPLFAAPQNPQTPQNPPVASGGNQQGIAMTEAERQQLLREAQVGGAVLGIGHQMQLQKAYAQFFQLNQRFPNPQEITAFEAAVAERLVNGGETIDVIAADVFNFAGTIQAQQQAEVNRQIEEARAAGRAEAIAEHPELVRGIPRARSAAPISKHYKTGASPTLVNQNVRVDSGNSTPSPPNPASQVSPNPNDNFAGLRDEHGRLPYQQRGNEHTRAAHLRNVVANRPDLFEAEYVPSYGQTPQS